MSPARGRNEWIRVAFMVLLAAAVGLGFSSRAFSIVLVSADEGAMKNEQESGASDSLSCENGDDNSCWEQANVAPEEPVGGPDIVMLLPKLETASASPLSLSVKFIAREGTKVDLPSLKVEYLKFIAINITERLKDYVKSDGIYVDKAELPSGTHKIRITIADTGGGSTTKTFVLKIR